MLLAISFSAAGQDKVVYHFDSALAHATKGLPNIRSHHDIGPKAKIIPVAHAKGVDFQMEVRRPATITSSQRSSDLARRHVRDLRDHAEESQLRKEQLILGPSFVPSGVVEIARLQSVEHSAYIKPERLDYASIRTVAADDGPGYGLTNRSANLSVGTFG